MNRRARQNHSAALKAMLAIAEIRRDRKIAEIEEQLHLHPDQVTACKG